MFSLSRSDHVSKYYQELRWLIQFHLAVMYHQYYAARGIMFVPPIEFGNYTLYNTRTQTYFVNLNRTQLSQTQKQARRQGTLIWNNLPSGLKEPMSYFMMPPRGGWSRVIAL